MENNNEIWKTAQYIFEDGRIEVFENYEVSNLGNVRSLNFNGAGKVKVMNLNTYKASGAIYYKVGLRKNNKQYMLSVHRLVLSSFDPEGWFPNADVDHIDARTELNCDNSLLNLRWFTRKENVSTEHRRKQLSKAMKGKLVNRLDMSKRVQVTNLTTGEVKTYSSAKDVDRNYELPKRSCSACIANRNGFYKKLNLHFEYIE